MPQDKQKLIEHTFMLHLDDVIGIYVVVMNGPYVVASMPIIEIQREQSLKEICDDLDIFWTDDHVELNAYFKMRELEKKKNAKRRKI